MRHDRRSHPNRIAAPALVLLLAGLAACYTYRTSAPELIGVTETKGTVVWSFFWGALNGTPPRVDNCNGQALSEVAVKENPLYWLLTLMSLGIASPKLVEWRCAPPNAQEGHFPTPRSGPTPVDTTGR